jgi:pimeloyl-ACP methyl ester carboxylesterase
MTTFVLVHPAWLGGWSWRKLTPVLRAAGHEVLTPTLTGLGDRAHLLDHGIDLATHVEDVVGLLVYEDLAGVALVGNSSGGMVVTGVADRVPERIAEVVHLDATSAARATRSPPSTATRSGPGRRRAGGTASSTPRTCPTSPAPTGSPTSSSSWPGATAWEPARRGDRAARQRGPRSRARAR